MIFITDELGKFEKNIIELAENMGFKECKTIEAIDLFCGISEKNDVLKESPMVKGRLLKYPAGTMLSRGIRWL